MCAEEDEMKLLILVLINLVLLSSCKESTTGPSLNVNLLTNPTFEQNGTPSFHGWTVVDTVGVELSADIPSNGSGRSIIVHPSWLPTWPIGIAYQVIPASAGTHFYRISVFGKRSGVSGGIAVRLNRPDNNPAQGWFPGIAIVDTVWTFYSQINTITASAGDSLFFAVRTGACELCFGSTFLNTFSFEKLN